jgi:sulfur relay (sulfurtransferase) complex TusBCD TusD component (DsrE family)
MGKYVLIETKGPLDGGNWAFELGKQLRELRHDVTVYLLQDGVFAARRNFKTGEALIQGAEKSGLAVVADGVSCRQRGLVGDRVAKGVGVGDMDALLDLVMERSDKAIWH